MINAVSLFSIIGPFFRLARFPFIHVQRHGLAPCCNGIHHSERKLCVYITGTGIFVIEACDGSGARIRLVRVFAPRLTDEIQHVLPKDLGLFERRKVASLK